MRLLITTLLSICTFGASATGDSAHYMLPTDSILIRPDIGGGWIFTHYLEPKQTLFSLAKFYGLTLEDIYANNPRSRFGNYNIGDGIIVPIPLKAILRDRPADYRSGRYAPVFYRVRKGDTVFGISRRYFDMPIDTLCARNRIWDNTIDPNRILFIGWLSTSGIPAEYQQKVLGPYERMNIQLKKQYLRDSYGKKLLEERGKAAWSKTGSSQFYALHRTAPINSVIEVVNPMNGRRFYLKVVGRVPDQIYDRNTVVVVSMLVVRALGARDDSFYVRVKHY